MQAPIDLPPRTKNRLNWLTALVGTLILAPLLAGLLKGYVIGRPPSPPGLHVSGGEIVLGVALVVVVLGRVHWWFSKVGWSPIVAVGITGVLMLGAAGLLGVISLGGSATDGQFWAGECFDTAGAATDCVSDATVFKLVKCSGVDTTDRQTVAVAESDLPGLKRVGNRAAVQDLCLASTAG